LFGELLGVVLVPHWDARLLGVLLVLPVFYRKELHVLWLHAFLWLLSLIFLVVLDQLHLVCVLCFFLLEVCPRGYHRDDCIALYP
jgi:hypothetical protein